MPTQDDARLERSMLLRMLEGGWDEVKDLPAGVLNTIAHPVDAVSALLEAHREEFEKAAENYHRGRYSEAVGHGAAGMLPVLGPAAASIGEEIGETGDIARGVGRTGALLGTLAAPKAISKGVKAQQAAVERAMLLNEENALLARSVGQPAPPRAALPGDGRVMWRAPEELPAMSRAEMANRARIEENARAIALRRLLEEQFGDNPNFVRREPYLSGDPLPGKR